MKTNIFIQMVILLLGNYFSCFAQHPFRPEGPGFSTAGFFKLPDNNSRQVFNFNNGWLYHKGDIKNAEKIDFKDNNWQGVSLPHGVGI